MGLIECFIRMVYRMMFGKVLSCWFRVMLMGFMFAYEQVSIFLLAVEMTFVLLLQQYYQSSTFLI